MKVVRILTYEGPEDEMRFHLNRCLADGVHDYFNPNMTLTIETTENPSGEQFNGIQRLFGPTIGTDTKVEENDA